MNYGPQSLFDLFARYRIEPPIVTNILIALRSDCAWFGNTEEVDEDIGRDLLLDAIPPGIVTHALVDDLVRWHNENARGPSNRSSNNVYSGLVEIVQAYGKEGALEGGEFWVIEDSVTPESAVIVKMTENPLPDGLLAALADWQKMQPSMRLISITDIEGDVLKQLEA